MKNNITKIKKERSGGFIALISVVIISFVLLLAATTLSFGGFYSRFNILDSESKEASDELADACIEHARLLLSLDTTINNISAYSGTASVGSDSCDYIINTDSTIVAHGSKRDANTYYKVTVNESVATLPITSFEELTTYP